MHCKKRWSFHSLCPHKQNTRFITWPTSLPIIVFWMFNECKLLYTVISAFKFSYCPCERSTRLLHDEFRLDLNFADRIFLVASLLACKVKNYSYVLFLLSMHNWPYNYWTGITVASNLTFGVVKIKITTSIEKWFFSTVHVPNFAL